MYKQQLLKKILETMMACCLASHESPSSFSPAGPGCPTVAPSHLCIMRTCQDSLAHGPPSFSADVLLGDGRVPLTLEPPVLPAASRD